MLRMFANDFFMDSSILGSNNCMPLIRVKIFFEEKISVTFGQNKGTNDLVFKKKKGKINEHKCRQS